jgi:signal transduction histidine kinase
MKFNFIGSLLSKRNSTLRRWIINNFMVIFVILVGIFFTSVILIRSYYYNSARQFLTARMNTVSGLLARSYADARDNYSNEVRQAVVNWSESDRIELMATSGNTVITSSGFTPLINFDTKDLQDALNTDAGYGIFTGKVESGENIVAVSLRLPQNSGGYTAMRMMSSLENVDKQVRDLILVMVVIGTGIMFLVGVSGMFFVRSIVVPVRSLGLMAGRYAKGDFSVRIAKKTDDEIGELCDVINKMAEDLQTTEAIKNEFISSVSHELRTPLTAIRGWSETIESFPDDLETVRKGMHVIHIETERLSQMVEELLDFSRMQNGKFTLQPAKMDILAEIGEAVLIYTERARQEDKEIIYDEPDMLPFIVGDKNRLRQVFINVIDNAVKYTDPGGKITVVSGMSDDTTIEIKVSDTGVGIAPADLPRIKTKFFKPNHSRRGSGIGLAVADEIVTMHGGTVTVESELGVGTTVTIRLPVKYLTA